MQKLHGFIMMHRKVLEWEWYSDANVSRVFFHLLLTASFKKTRWQGIEVLPGQVITSYAHLSDALGLSSWQIRTALNKLGKTGEIKVKSTTKYTLITIVKWAFYQSGEEKIYNESTSNLQPSYNQSQHRNNVNNDNNVDKYPRTRGKLPSAKQEVFNPDTDEYDYDAIRKKSRERIRRIAKAYAEAHSIDCA